MGFSPTVGKDSGHDGLWREPCWAQKRPRYQNEGDDWVRGRPCVIGVNYHNNLLIN